MGKFYLSPKVPLPMKPSNPKPTICFVQINALGLLDPKVRIPFGGAEVRARAFARMLQDSGQFEVAFAVVDETGGTRPKTTPTGIKVHLIPPHPFHPQRLTLEVRDFYKGIRADCFISLGANEVSHELVAYARLLGTPSMVGLASDQSLGDSVFNGSMVLNEYRVPHFHAWEAMHQANVVLAQTQWQLDWLYRKTGQRGVLVPNPIPMGWEGDQAAQPAQTEFDFLWVGRPCTDKNPELMLEVARRLESATFRMVLDSGRTALPAYWRNHLPASVVITDRLESQDELRNLMKSCRAIVNSSPAEGFPNLMLQGATVGCPCIFLNVDPDGWASEHGCAASAHGDVDTFLGLLERAQKDADWLQDMARRAAARATSCHSTERVKQDLIGAVKQALTPAKKDRI